MATGAADYMGYFLWKRLFMGAGVVLPLFWITKTLHTQHGMIFIPFLV